MGKKSSSLSPLPRPLVLGDVGHSQAEAEDLDLLGLSVHVPMTVQNREPLSDPEHAL